MRSTFPPRRTLLPYTKGCEHRRGKVYERLAHKNSACGAEPAGLTIQDKRAGSGVDSGYPVHSDTRRLVVFGGGDGLVHAHYRGLDIG